MLERLEERCLLAGAITEFPVPTAGSFPTSITAGPDHNLWFTEGGANKIGRITTAGVITEFPVPLGFEPTSITAGPGGNLWFTEIGTPGGVDPDYIGQITTAGVITEFPITGVTDADPAGIAVGSNGNLWFTEIDPGYIGEMTPAGVMVGQFPVPTPLSGPLGITAGPDGNLWFTESLTNKIGQITTAGAITEFPLITAASDPTSITAGPDGYLWFTEQAGNNIGQMSTAGYLVGEYPVPTAGSAPAGITAGPDGNLWFTEGAGSKIGRITTAGVFTGEFATPTAASGPLGITAGPDGNIWFTEAAGNNIGKLALDLPLTPNSNGTTVHATEGASFTQLVGTFQDTDPTATASDYSVTIDWGDGTPTSAGSVVANGTVFDVMGTHTYAEEGTHSITVTIVDTDTSHDPGGSTATIHSLAVVVDAALTAGAPTPPLTPNTGVALPASTVVGTFTDANTAAPASDFTATINWGDGSPASTGVVIVTGGGGFKVEGGHIYAKPGVYTTTTNVLDDGGSTVTLTGSATVTDLPVTGAVNSFTAVEGKNTGTIVLATFTDPNTLATVADVHATLPVGGWGDGTPIAVTTLAVTEIGVDPTTGDPIFEVTGSHKYAEEGVFTVNISVTTLGGAITALTPGTATVVDAKLTSSNGTEITGVEGNSTGTILLGSFRDANQAATVADYTAGGGSVTVNWGDGSSLPLTATNLASLGLANGVVWTVNAAHTYTEEGTFAYTVTVTDDGGSSTIFSGSAIIADAKLTASAAQPAVAIAEAAVFTGPVASFIDANPKAPVSDFTATIDWGDGTPLTAGTVGQPGGVGTAFIVSGTHTYADSGVNGTVGIFPIQVFVVDDGGSRLTVDNTANVADNPIVLTGVLNPASDSGLSTGTVNVTKVNQPDFYGTSEPFSHVTLFATLLPSGTAVQIGQVQAGSDGSWNIKSGSPLADGHYAIAANAVDQFGVTTAAPTVITPDLLIDTKGPVIDGMFFNRLNGQVDYIIQDPTPASGGVPSGVWVNSLLDSSNYLFTKVHVAKAYAGKWVVTNVTATADPTISNAYDVAVTLNGGAVIQGGYYLFTIRDSSNGKASVQDLAENHLDGEFYGSFPSGNGIPGGDFVAELEALHNKVFSPQSIVGTANNANGGVGGLPVGAIHSGIWVPLDPRGGAPIFSTTIDPPVKKAKTPVVVKAKPKVAVIAPKTSQVKKASVVVTANHPAGPLHKK